MKNFKTIIKTGLFISALMFIFSAAVFAEAGEAVGYIYSTDILAVVNGFPMESYSINGKTAVIAEDLSEHWYGFKHEYNDNDRTLYLWSARTAMPDHDVVVSVKRGIPGAVVGNFHETDIKVVCNGHEVPGYNIGGKMAVCIEDLGTLDDSENAQYGYSKYLCNFTYNDDTRTVTLNSFMDNSYKVIHDIESERIEYNFISSNIIEPVYNPMILNFEINNIKNPSDEENVLKPLYFSIDGNLTEVGLCYVQTQYGYDHADVHCMMDYNKANNAVLSQIKKEILPYDEALSLFYDSGKYKVYDRCENDKYTVLLVKESNSDIRREGESDIDYFRRDLFTMVLLKKSGGYCGVDQITNDEEVTMNFINDDEFCYTTYTSDDAYGNPRTWQGILNFSFDIYAN